MPSFQSQHLLFRTTLAEDDGVLRALLNDNAMEGWVKLALAREPNFFAGENLFGPSTTVLALDQRNDLQAVGMYTHAVFPLWLNGQATQTAYLGGLRVNPHYRQRIRIIKAGFASIAQLCPPTDVCFTSVAQHNAPARRLLETGVKGLPRYTLAGEMTTLALPVRHDGKTNDWQVAQPDDIEELCCFYNQQAAAFHFAPVLQPDWLSSLNGCHGLNLQDFCIIKQQGRIVACVALWDQRGYKQTVVSAYRFPLNKFRWLYNAWARCSGRIRLPAPGQMLSQIFLAFFAVAPALQADIVPLLKQLQGLATRKSAQVAILGLSSQHAYLPALRAAFAAQCYETRIETVSWQQPPQLDSRLVQPEVAIL